jgi:dihydroxy-acid dehydratase
VGTSLKYELAIRDALAASIEITARVHHFDGLVLLASCDSIIPGQLMGAARVDVPSLMVTGGPMLAGELHGEAVLSPDVNEAVFGALPLGRISEQDLLDMENCACPSVGACPVMGTANTMQILTEAMGMALSGSATIPAILADKRRMARRSGQMIVELVRRAIRPSDILDIAKCHCGQCRNWRLNQCSPPYHEYRKGAWDRDRPGPIRRDQQKNTTSGFCGTQWAAHGD